MTDLDKGVIDWAKGEAPWAARYLHIEGCDTWREAIARHSDVLEEDPKRETKIICQPGGRYTVVWF